MTQHLSTTGPAWKIEDEYASMDCPEFLADVQELESKILKLQETAKTLKPLMQIVLSDTNGTHVQQQDELSSLLHRLAPEISRIRVLLAQLRTYVTCILCIENSNGPAVKAEGALVVAQSNFETTGKPIWMFLDQVGEKFVNRYLASPQTNIERFSLDQSRLLSATLLSEKEEILLSRFKTHGPVLWGDLYNKISGSIRCRVANADGTSQDIGLAQAMGMLRSSSEVVRFSAWQAIQEGWRQHKDACASILNGLAGWRLEETKLRSHTRAQHYLDLPLHLARLSPETLTSMTEAVRRNISIPHRAMRALAQGLRKPCLDPWDLLAAAPSPLGLFSFDKAIDLVREAFAHVDPSLADFVTMMKKNGWIEGRILPGKRQGAFCTRFAKSGSPRVYQSFGGTMGDLRTLAHELGHAFHFWNSRDLPEVLHRSPMTLMESASIFAETALTDYLCSQSDPQVQLAISWQSVESSTMYLLNMPARYEFEKNFYDRRQKGLVSADELCELTDSAWKNWYGDTLSGSERLFWASKLHFSLPWISFYNYPYTFGYLFSLKLYSLFKQNGAAFMPSYAALLRDTGCMTAEQLARTHLSEDIQRAEFWESGISTVENHVGALESQVLKAPVSRAI
jgi:oligoendopeptidase F